MTHPALISGLTPVATATRFGMAMTAMGMTSMTTTTMPSRAGTD